MACCMRYLCAFQAPTARFKCCRTYRENPGNEKQTPARREHFCIVISETPTLLGWLLGTALLGRRKLALTNPSLCAPEPLVVPASRFYSCERPRLNSTVLACDGESPIWPSSAGGRASAVPCPEDPGTQTEMVECAFS